jgi:hypothetical protein
MQMKREELSRGASPDAIVERVTAGRVQLPPQDQDQDDGHGHGGQMVSVREATYRGRHIVVRTTYQLEVDGMPIKGHMGVTNDGQVHYHAVPNLGFASAVDLVKQLIDTFPEDFEAGGDNHSHGQGS